MKPLLEVLQTINDATDRYRTLQLSHTIEQSEILRDLSVSFKDLTDHKIESGKEWLNAYNSIKGSNASRERHADTEVMEYDLITANMKAVSNLMDAIRSTLSANKNA